MPKQTSQQITSLPDLVKSISIRVSGSSKYDKFKRLYEDDRIAFAYDCVNIKTLADYQIEILGRFDEGSNRVAVRGPHGLGKTLIAAILVHHAVLTAESDCKVPTTASAWRQLEKYLWPEIKKVAKLLAWPVIGRPQYDPNRELLGTSIKLNDGIVEAFALASDNHALIEGAHASKLVYIYDEAKTIPVPTWDAAEGAFASEDLTDCILNAFAISTPGNPSGRFFDIHMRKPGYEDWYVMHVTLEQAIRAKRISVKWAEQRERQWGRDSSIYQNRVLGEFADNSEDGIIPLSWVRKAQVRWREWKEKGMPHQSGRKVLGIDPARMGRDSTVVAEKVASTLKCLVVIPKLPVTSTCGRIINLLSGHYIHIEMEGGLGASIYDILREHSAPNLRPIQVGGKTYWRGRSGELKFMNVRIAMWWNMRELLDPDFGQEVALPPDPFLEADLTTPIWDNRSDGTMFLESKRDIMSRLGRSPDWGTACCLAFWNPSAGGGVMF